MKRALTAAGITLVEATIVLAVMSILAAVGAPTVARTVQNARLARVRTDQVAIKVAIELFLTNTTLQGFSPTGGATAITVGSPSNANETLVSDGDIPVCAAAPAPVVGHGCGLTFSWRNTVGGNGTLTDYLERHLVTNTPGGLPANDYAFGATGWKGAYLNAPIDPDPWGNRYAVNVMWLTLNSSCAAAGRSNDTFVMSAGPDLTIDTPYRFDTLLDTPTFTVQCVAGGAGTGAAYAKGDDIITIVRRDLGVSTP